MTRPRPVQVRARVLANEPVGAYHRLVLHAAAVAEAARPGQFVAVAVGDEPTAMLLRRAFSLHRADPERGRVEVVVAAHGPGTRWLTRRRSGDVLDVVGPLGRPFPGPMSSEPVGCVLVGGGYGTAPLMWFADVLVRAGTGVDLVLGAASAPLLFGVEEALELVGPEHVHVTTDDGSAGTRGRVTDVLAPLLAEGPEGVHVYACGPMAMLRAVTAAAAEHRAVAWCTVEESMACGIGVCMTCVLPVRGTDGVTRMTRSCTDGPTFQGAAVRWDSVCAGPNGRGSLVPPDCLGAPAGGHR